MATPLLKALRTRYPDAKIVLLANHYANDLLKGAWFLDEIVSIDFPWSTYKYTLTNLFHLSKLLGVSERTF